MSGFVKTSRQVEALDVLNHNRHAMLYGGARSGKTVIVVRNLFLRALKRPSKHLIVRYRYNHARISLGHETIPWVLAHCFPGVVARENKSDGYWTVASSRGGESQVWLGGTDDKERVEKILGNEYCVDPETRVLMADLRWVRADSLVPGDELVGFDEESPHVGSGFCRKLRASVITRSDIIQTRKFRVTTDQGETIVSAGHLFLSKNNGNAEWVMAENVCPGDRLGFFSPPWETDQSRDGGWLAGIFDGEGCIGKNGHVVVGQNEGPVLDEICRVLMSKDINFKEYMRSPRQKTDRHFVIQILGKTERLRLLGMLRPVRLLRKARTLWEGTKLTTKSSPDAIVLKVEELGEGSVIALGTTTKTFVADGFLGHNSTIYANECSQIPFEAITLLWTRLAENSGLEQRFYYDCNPPGKKHWTNLLFLEKTLPDKTPHDLEVGHLQVNPGHNLENLSPEYMRALESLPKRQRQRFLKGEYLADVEGALWTDEMIVRARLREPKEFRKTVIAVDPSVSNNPDSDECGIIPCSIDIERMGVVRGDLSGKMSTRKWAQRAVGAYHAYEANCIVAEKNQGGDLVADAIHNIDPFIKVELVHSSVGKMSRAEPVSMLYEQDHVSHVGDYPDLEAELTETDFDEITESPNRLDALVHGLTYLMVGRKKSRYFIG